MRNITQLFVNRSPLVFVLLALIAIVGGFSLATLVQQQFPNIDFPTVNISVSYPGASPSELRDAVVRPLEDAIAGAPDLDHITSSIQQNQASISATFTLDSNQTTDLTSVQDRIQSAKSALPVDLPAPSVRTFDPAQAVVVTLSLTSNSLNVSDLSAIVTNNIVPTLEQVDGISSVTANGTVTPALEVTVDPQKLSSFGFTPNDIVSSIQGNNVRDPGGIVYGRNRETSVDIRGDLTTAPAVAAQLVTGTTAVLTGATSPSGTLTQKYNSPTGSTNQALALGSSTTSNSSTASGVGTSAGLSSTIGTVGAVGVSAGATGVAPGAGTSTPAPALLAAGATPTPSPTPTAIASATPTATAATPVPASTIVPSTTTTTATTSTAGTASARTSGTSAAGDSTSSAGTTVTNSAAGSTGTGTAGTTTTGTTTTGTTTTGATTTGATTTTTTTTTTTAGGTTTSSVGSASASAPTPAAIAAIPNATPAAAQGTASTSTSASGVKALVSIPTISAIGSAAASTGAASSVTNPFSTATRLPRIGDVAKVTDGYEPKRVDSYVNGKYAITLNVQKATGASEVTSAENVLAALPAIEAQYPDIAFHVLNNQADETKAQLYGVLQTLIEGIVFTGIAMVFFLRSWRNALVVMIAIPASLLVTFFVMKLMNYTIDTVSLLAMTLIIGILVDDSIVVLENVERHYEDGEAPRTAAILGRTEIGAAAVVITLVDVVVFLPIAFLPGQTGRFLGEFGVVVTIATLTSLAISFTITPSLAGNWSLLSNWRPPRFILGFSENFARLRTFYSERILMGAFRHPKSVVAVSALLTAGAISLIPLGFVGFEFIPSVDRGQIFVSIQFPTGTPLTTTDAAVKSLTNAYLQQLSDVQTIVSTTGTSQAGFGGSVNLGSNGQLRVFLAPNRKQSTDVVARRMTGMAHRIVPDAKVVAIPATGTRGGNSQPIDITVSTTRGEPEAYAQQVLQVLQDTPGTANVNSSALNLAPQFDIEFNRDRARALNVDIGSAALAIKAAFGGALATQFDGANGTKYIQVLYPITDDTTIATLDAITLRSLTGGIVHLGDVVELVNDPAQALITRNNRETVVHISSNVAPGAALSNVQNAFRQRLAALHLPNTVIVGTGAGGTQQNLDQTVSGLSVSLVLSFTLVFLLMIALYNAYRAPLVIMFAIPVAAIGAFGSLAITGQSLNLYSLIGVVMLVGLVSKNGILLVDFAQLKVSGGLDKLTAMKQAARERFRPIVMTTCSMIAGMLPLALALDPGSAAKRSLGTVVIGGLTSSLLLTLVLVPVVFLWIAPGPPPDVLVAELPGGNGAVPHQPLESR